MLQISGSNMSCNGGAAGIHWVVSDSQRLSSLKTWTSTDDELLPLCAPVLCELLSDTRWRPFPSLYFEYLQAKMHMAVILMALEQHKACPTEAQ